MTDGMYARRAREMDELRVKAAKLEEINAGLLEALKVIAKMDDVSIYDHVAGQGWLYQQIANAAIARAALGEKA